MIEEKTKIQYSEFQEDIFNTVMTTNRNIVVKATAGSGKTFTTIEISKLIPSNKSCIFVAFNKSIVEELQLKLPPNIECCTVHSKGMSVLTSFFKTHLKLNEFKSFRFSEKYLKDLDRKEKFIKMFKYADILNKVRLTLQEITSEMIIEICVYYDIDIEGKDIDNLINISEDMSLYNYFLGSENNIIDYTDMIHLPVVQTRIKLNQYDYVIVDELQDLNKCQREFIKRIIKPGGRFIGVGDDFQCIYSFLGADPGSFKSFSELPNTIQLPLSISYRCSKAVVKEAKKICPDIHSHNQAIKGEVRKGDFDEVQEGDFILCRNNRPLIYAYFKMIQRGLKCVIRGKDIEKGLVDLIIKVKSKDVSTGMEYLNSKLALKQMELKEKGISKPTGHPSFLLLKEKVLTIQVIINFKKFGLMDQVISFIEEVFSDDSKEGVQLMTVHKSKGLEAESVFFIETFEGKKLIPSIYATKEWELEQEKNLMFVAITRAKNKFIYLAL